MVSRRIWGYRAANRLIYTGYLSFCSCSSFIHLVLSPVLEVPLRIIEKYRSERQSDKVFNLYSRKHLIILTRKLGQAYGFDMTFHVARHNFGTHITLSMGVPIETVSRMMGHKSITTTQIYAKVTDKKVGEDMKGLKTRTKGRKIVLCEEDVSVMKKKRAQSDKEKAAFA